jgi:agarase
MLLSRRTFLAGLAAVSALAALPAIAPLAGAAGAPATAPGVSARTSAADNSFRVERRNGRWWFITPAGATLFSAGVDFVTPSGMVAVDNTNPYRALMHAKYGNPINMTAWAADAGGRLTAWGFNTVGAFSAGARGALAGLPDTPQLYPLHQGVIPAMRRANGGGDAYPLMVVSPNDGWDFHRLFVDVYHPTFADAAEAYFAAQLPARAADPTLIGYFLDNELPFYYRKPVDLLATDANHPGAVTLADSYIALGAGTHAKRAWVALLRRRYDNAIADLNAAWGTGYGSFDALLTVAAVPGSNAARRADKSAFLADIAETYFRTYRDAFRRHDPNHLILGCRFVGLEGIDTPPEVLRAAGWYQDVVSINYYIWATETYEQRRARVRARYATFAAGTGRPILNGEFSFGARDSGMPSTRPLGELVDTQAQRGQRYADMVRITAEIPEAVGLHWWGYIDPPVIGALNGGEDGNYGLVNNLDIPYAGLIQAAAAINPQLHAIHAAAPPIGVFPDVPGGTPEAAAIAELTARGIIKGYSNGRFGPGDTTLRAQMAALICRAMGWDSEDWGNDFRDRGGLDATLWRNAGTLARYGVARGYDGVNFGPNDKVTYAQTISFITRAMVTRGYWRQQPGAPLPHAGVPDGHAPDVRTYAFYTGALGGVPAPPANWSAPATRGWFSQALWRALTSYYGAP